jgi:hypothetical protein
LRLHGLCVICASPDPTLQAGESDGDSFDDEEEEEEEERRPLAPFNVQVSMAEQLEQATEKIHLTIIELTVSGNALLAAKKVQKKVIEEIKAKARAKEMEETKRREAKDLRRKEKQAEELRKKAEARSKEREERRENRMLGVVSTPDDESSGAAGAGAAAAASASSAAAGGGGGGGGGRGGKAREEARAKYKSKGTGDPTGTPLHEMYSLPMMVAKPRSLADPNTDPNNVTVTTALPPSRVKAPPSPRWHSLIDPSSTKPGSALTYYDLVIEACIRVGDGGRRIVTLPKIKEHVLLRRDGKSSNNKQVFPYTHLSLTTPPLHPHPPFSPPPLPHPLPSSPGVSKP